MKTLTKELQELISPNQALQLLKDGNKRFINNLKVNRNLLEQALQTSDGQHPFAVILSCIDSRTSAELIFDQGIGDIFSVRIAGNIVNEDIIGSLEFSCKVAGARIVVVLGHTSCGAVKGACDGVQLGSLTTLLNKIQPAIQHETLTLTDRNSSNATFVSNVTVNNVKHAMAEIAAGSSILSDMIKSNEIIMVGGIHDINSGEVTFLS